MAESAEWRIMFERQERDRSTIEAMIDLILRDHFDQHGGNPHLCRLPLCRMAAPKRRWY